MKIVRDTVHLSYRVMRIGNYEAGGRYYLGFGEHGAELNREAPWGTHHKLTQSHSRCELRKWHDLEIRVVGRNTKFYVDGVLGLDHTDDRPPERGSIAFDVHTPGSPRVYFDDVVVVGSRPSRDFQWVKLNGPLGGTGYDVRIDPVNPDIMYVTDTFAGVAKSTDGGNTWAKINEGITARTGPSGDAIPIFCLTIDPSNHNVIWAGTKETRGIYKSTDAGKTWTQMDNGIVETSEITLRSFAVDPRNSNIVYCGAEIASGAFGPETPKQKGKIYKTTNGGKKWSQVWHGDALVRHIIIDPTDSNTVYAATGIMDRVAFNADIPNGKPGGVGILKTTNGGRSWASANGGLTNLYVGYLAMHPTDHRTLYAATGDYTTNRIGMASGLLVTYDGAKSWSKLIHEDYYPFTAVRVSRSNPRIIYAGTEKSIYRTEDRGRNWREFGKGDRTYGPPGIRAGIPIDLTIDPRDPNHVYVNNYQGGVFQSDDGARTWRDSSAGYSGAELRDLAISSFDHNNLYVVGRSGPFRTSDGGQSWMGIRGAPGEMHGVVDLYAIESAPDNPENVIATSEGRAIVYQSANGGRNWTEVWRHPANLGDVNKRHGFKALRFAPSDPDTVYAGICFRRVRVEYEGRNDLSYGVYVSRDGGNTWVERNNRLRSRSNMNIHDIAVLPTNPGIAYAATNDSGVFATASYGERWAQVMGGVDHKPPNLSVRALAIDPRNPRRIYAGVEKGGIYLSTDMGRTWSPIYAGMDPYASIHSIA